MTIKGDLQVLVTCLSTDVKPTAVNGAVLLETDTGNFYYSLNGSWTQLASGVGVGDMLKAVYDPDTDGVIAIAQLDPTVATKNTDIRIQDADADTKIQVEESADEDIVRIDVAGVEAFNLNAVGILTLAKQSGAFASSTLGQTLPASSGAAFFLANAEAYDIQGEMDVTNKTGTSTATSANHLVDTTANQFTADDVGRHVYNITDTKYAKITAFNSVSDVTLDTDIIPTGKSYRLNGTSFKAAVAGLYIAGIVVTMNGNSADGGQLQPYVCKNYTKAVPGIVAITPVWAPAANLYLAATSFGPVQLAVNDTLEFLINQSVAATKALYAGASSYNYVWVAKIA